MRTIGAFALILLAGSAHAQDRQAPRSIDPLALHLRAGKVDTRQARADLHAVAGAAAAGRRFVVQLDGPITEDRRAALTGAGVELGDYLPANAWIVRMDRADPAKVRALNFVRWFDVYRDDWKLDPRVGAMNFATPERRALSDRGEALLAVSLFDDVDERSVRGVIATINAVPGVRVQEHARIGGAFTLTVRAPYARVADLIAMDPVQFVEESAEVSLRNSTSRWIVQSNQTGVFPLYNAGLRGENQIMGVVDSAMDRNHCSFADAGIPIGPTHRKILAYNTPFGSTFHGTHVAGTAVGDAGAETDTRGVAYLAKMVFSAIPQFTETGLYTVFSLHHSQGARVHNNSWGSDTVSDYGGPARAADAFSYDFEDSLLVFAATNGTTVKTPENSKNGLAVTASSDTPIQDNYCDGGDGPTPDGRRKPELAAPGCGILSSRFNTACSAIGASGTSMAAPAISGIALLARQYFVDGFHPSGAATPTDAFTPSGALLKAVLLNSAVDMSGIAGFPSNREGWGRLLADNALYFPGDARRMWVYDARNAEGMGTAQEQVFNIEVTGSTEPLKVTLVWTEPPASAGALNAVVNDLDLEVYSPNAVMYRGNDFAAGVSTVGGSRDSLNNVEMVLLPGPQTGIWSIRVAGAAVNEGTQGFALVVTGQLNQAEQELSIFALGLPEFVSPGEASSFEVRINPGDQTLVENSPTLHYRADPGDPFAQIPLVDLGDGVYRADMPGAACGDQPEYFVSAESVEGGVRTAPFDAPAWLYTFQPGDPVQVQAFAENFEAGLPSGWSASGLWNVTGLCAQPDPCDATTTAWAYFGEPGGCTYDTGQPEAGVLISPPITLPPMGPITLTYCSNLDAEALTTYDEGIVRVNGVEEIDRPFPTNAWETRVADLSAYAGQTITLHFEFDTIDEQVNEFRGWQIDNLVITGFEFECNVPACPGDTDSDGDVDFDDLNAAITYFGLATGATREQGDLDGDGDVDFNDLNEVLFYWDAACE